MKKKLYEEKGPYQYEDWCEQVGDAIENGDVQGDLYYGRKFGPILINGEDASTFFKSSEVKSLILRDISYPVKDGHASYDGLDEIVGTYSGLNFRDPDVQEDLVKLGFDEEEVKSLALYQDADSAKDEEIETWIDYDIQFDDSEADYGDDEEDEDGEFYNDNYIASEVEESSYFGKNPVCKDKRIGADDPSEDGAEAVSEGVDDSKYLTKDQLIAEINKGNLPEQYVAQPIGQGDGYKIDFDIWNNKFDENIVVYIPEFGYDEDGMPKEDSIYSFKDFLDICKGNREYALQLLEDVDWQSPETLYDEYGWGDDEVEEAVERQPDMFGGEDTIYKDGVEALDFDNILDAVQKIAPKMGFVDAWDKGDYYVMKFEGENIDKKRFEDIKSQLIAKFGDGLKVQWGYHQYAPEQKSLFVAFIDRANFDDEELNEGIKDYLPRGGFMRDDEDDKSSHKTGAWFGQGTDEQIRMAKIIAKVKFAHGDRMGRVSSEDLKHFDEYKKEYDEIYGSDELDEGWKDNLKKAAGVAAVAGGLMAGTANAANMQDPYDDRAPHPEQSELYKDAVYVNQYEDKVIDKNGNEYTMNQWADLVAGENPFDDNDYPPEFIDDEEDSEQINESQNLMEGTGNFDMFEDSPNLALTNEEIENIDLEGDLFSVRNLPSWFEDYSRGNYPTHMVESTLDDDFAFIGARSGYYEGMNIGIVKNNEFEEWAYNNYDEVDGMYYEYGSEDGITPEELKALFDKRVEEEYKKGIETLKYIKEKWGGRFINVAWRASNGETGYEEDKSLNEASDPSEVAEEPAQKPEGDTKGQDFSKSPINDTEVDIDDIEVRNNAWEELDLTGIMSKIEAAEKESTLGGDTAENTNISLRTSTAKSTNAELTPSENKEQPKSKEPEIDKTDQKERIEKAEKTTAEIHEGFEFKFINEAEGDDKISFEITNGDGFPCVVEVSNKSSGHFTADEIKEVIEKENPSIWFNDADAKYWFMDFSFEKGGKTYWISSDNIEGDMSKYELSIYDGNNYGNDDDDKKLNEAKKEPAYKLVKKTPDFDIYQDFEGYFMKVGKDGKVIDQGFLSVEDAMNDGRKATQIDEEEMLDESVGSRGMIKAIEKAFDDGRYGRYGDWECGLGGYDTGYQVSYKHIPFFEIKEDNTIKFLSNNLMKRKTGYTPQDIIDILSEIGDYTISTESYDEDLDESSRLSELASKMVLREADESSVAKVKINSVKFEGKEGAQDDKNWVDGKTYSFEEFQKLVYEYDYAFQAQADNGGYDKLWYTADITVEHNGKQEHIGYDGRLDLGDGKYGLDSVSVAFMVKQGVAHNLGIDPSQVEILNPEVPYDSKAFAAKYGTHEENLDKFLADKASQIKTPKYSKDSDNMTPEEIEVGDYFADNDSNGFYRVVRRSKASVWLERVKSKVIRVPYKNNRGELEYDNDAYPTTEPDTDDRWSWFDTSKPFRLGGYGHYVSASQGRHSLWFWGGKEIAESFAKKGKALMEDEEVLPEADQALENPFKEGDILYSSWGYSMRLVDFYKVISSSKSFVKLAHLVDYNSQQDEYGQAGKKMPKLDQTEPDSNVDGRRFKVHIRDDGKAFVKINNYEWAEMWDGKPKSFDTYD